MKPPSNLFPPNFVNQFQSTVFTAPTNPQLFPANHALANSRNMLQNSMPMQPPVGLINPQIPIPFSNSSTHLSNNGQAMPNFPPFIIQQPGLMLTPSPNNLGMLAMGRSLVGFSPQNQVNNLNTFPMFVNQVNPCQLQGDMFSSSFPNLPQQFNQNMGFASLQTPLQSMNPVVSPQMTNPSQVSNFNMPSSGHQAVGPQQNPGFFANPMYGVEQQVNPNQQNVMMPTIVANLSNPMPIANQQAKGNPSTLQNSQPPGFNRPQGNPFKNGQGNSSNCKWKNFRGKNVKKNLKNEAPQLGCQKSQFHHMNNGKRKFRFLNEEKGEEAPGDERAVKTSRTNPTDQAGEKKRPLAFTYTEQEIKKWREERKRNYPSTANIEKKQTAKLTNAEVTDREARIRCEQLKEILVKQAELGVEVAEIPSHYLLDSEKKVQRREGNRKFITKKGRSRNKYGKRGRYNKKEQSAKQQMLAAKDSSNTSSWKDKRKATLLQKLLSADIRKDKRQLLHVFRFMVVNSFFKDWPEKPLKFPLVVVKEAGCEDEVVEEKYSLAGKGVTEVTNKTTVQSFGVDGDSDTGGDDVEGKNNEKKYKSSLVGDADEQEGTSFSMEKSLLARKVDGTEEEEGEIID